MLPHPHGREWRDAKRPLLVCHDAGGAEIVSAWARRHPRPGMSAVVDGPASGIFARKLPTIPRHAASMLADRLHEADFVLAGSGWASNLERDAVAGAHERGVYVAVFLDHWVNYEERFRALPNDGLPDEIWVGDLHAEAAAKACFPRAAIRKVGNPYFDDMRAELLPLLASRESEPRVTRTLYVTEPITEHLDKGTQSGAYTEFDALEYALRKFEEQQARGESLRIRIRLHPAEPPAKYDRILERHPHLPLEISSGNSLVQDCAWADVVVGCESMAMVIGLLAERQVRTSIPPGGRACRLPHAEIIPL